jgi:hypothetical protein
MWRRPGVYGLLAAGSLLLPAGAGAAESDIQLWTVFNLHHGITESWGAHLSLRGRFDDDVTHAKDLLVRAFGSWQWRSSLSTDLGYDYIHSFDGRDEHRPWQAAEYRLRWSDLLVKNRVRLDQRFVEGVDGVVVRFRYRLRGSYLVPNSDWYLALSDEIFTNLNDQGSGPVDGFEQNRLRVAVGGVRFLRRRRAECGYEWQHALGRSRLVENRHVFLIEFSVDSGALWQAPKSPP